ncbi:MAG TPA: phospholipase D-like domain-containing protein [Nocardioidaceae bacterium]|nr:phospholipase D-like domain-containing protein [Nocardioidaceae bacterium]
MRPSIRQRLLVPATSLLVALSACLVVVSGTSASVAATRVNPRNPLTWHRTSPAHYTPRFGAKFNNPYGRRAARGRLVHKVVRTIDSSPGYVRPRTASGAKVPCPSNPRFFPSRIKISLYSIASRAFVAALIRAHRRCVSVQLLMNNHLDATTSRSWGALLKAIGNDRRKRSWTRRCVGGCRGHAVLHSKFYLFSHAGNARNVVMVGSSNMTTNAVRIQYNDLFTSTGSSTLLRQYTSIFNQMKRDRVVSNPLRVYKVGRYTSTFYPFPGATARTDRTMAALNSIRCSGARGAGVKGHSVLYINMHSWHGTRGRYLAKRVRTMYNRGCYVRILYSFMGHGTFAYLTHGTGPRMVARRVLFPGPRGLVAAKYSHMKMFAASGRIGSDRSSWVTWTGSNNWADRSIHGDEVTLRISSYSVYRSYVAHWKAMRERRSSPVWAIYPEPGGGGRAPD